MSAGDGTLRVKRMAKEKCRGKCRVQRSHMVLVSGPCSGLPLSPMWFGGDFHFFSQFKKGSLKFLSPQEVYFESLCRFVSIDLDRVRCGQCMWEGFGFSCVWNRLNAQSHSGDYRYIDLHV